MSRIGSLKSLKTQRRPLMRKCKEKGLRRKNSRTIKRRTRNCVKRKYAFEESEENVITVTEEDKTTKEEEVTKMEETIDPPPPLPDVITSTLTSVASSKSISALPIPVVMPPQPVVLLSKPTNLPAISVQPTAVKPSEPATTVQPAIPAAPKKKKVNKTIGYRTRKRRRKPRKLSQPVVVAVPEVVTIEPELPKIVEEAAAVVQSSETSEAASKQPVNNSESCWNTETHFKTGDYVISIDSQGSECPPIWRIEGKNVLQLFEVLEGEGSTNILYRNTSSVCQNGKIQFVAHFQGQVYDPMTLESKEDSSSASDFNFPLCGSCVQTVTLYSRLHHHKYHFFQLGCKKVKDVTKGEDKDSHTILEDCLQDIEWVTQMFQDMLEMWNACDKYRSSRYKENLCTLSDSVKSDLSMQRRAIYANLLK
ncbi:hypothetical protein HNY73_008062 [Argiope bruennichi]|uniref:Uncharacterized protein n=1 Tax=Argiope bruennichi TaxID=94029 RepID=A0A8T0F7Y3_ARGBR|nr:hypothetical protein HNY73_008062 [Argiope bruennichi]